jgi:hypothetical protein
VDAYSRLIEMESPTPMIEGTDNDDKLREQVMINQFCNQVGCPPEMAVEILQAARWQIEVIPLPCCHSGSLLISLRWLLAYSSRGMP